MADKAMGTGADSTVSISTLRDLCLMMARYELTGIPWYFWDAFAEAVHEPEHPHVHVDMQEHGQSRPIVLVSGGLDSSITYRRLKEDDRKPLGLYIDFGQPYLRAEHQACYALGIEFETTEVKLGPRNEAWKHILPARNMLALLSAAEFCKPGTPIYFAVVHGESPLVGGDKSERFLRLMNRLLPYNPIFDMTKKTKSEWLKQGLEWGWDRKWFLQSYSCFGSTPGVQCGTCQACLRHYIAFVNCGYSDEEILFNYAMHPLDGCTEAIEKYLSEMNKPKSRYDRRRIDETLPVITRRRTG